MKVKEEQHRFHIVIPLPLLEKLRAVARRNNRSVRAQILYILQQALRHETDEPT